jgi:hypothetical protein
VVAQVVAAALKSVFDTPDLDQADRIAACLVAERVMLATVVGLRQAQAPVRKD